MEEATKNWLALARTDYADSAYLFQAARYPNALYLLCQAVEKALKAAQTALARTTPQKTHNLVWLGELSGLALTSAQQAALEELNRHYRRIRYRDLAQTDYQTKAKVAPILAQGKTMYLWILTQLDHN
jgi:HEPN domain-containing protein